MVNEGAYKLEAYFFLGIYTLPLPKSRKVGSLVGKLLGRKRSSPKRVLGDPTSNLFFVWACLGAQDAACPRMEWWEDSKFSALFSLLLETSVFQPWMYPNLLGKNTSDNK